MPHNQAERRPAEEVVFAIANRPVEEQRDAYRRLGTLTVSALRKIQQLEAPAPVNQISATGRPRNYSLSLSAEESPIATITTHLTPKEWKRRGGSRAFWQALKKLTGIPEIRAKLHGELS
jgi:hypothetical protein